MAAKLYGNVGYRGGIQAITFLGNQRSFKNFMALFTLESMGKPKMWTILKTADHRVKQMEIWDSGYYIAYI